MNFFELQQNAKMPVPHDQYHSGDSLMTVWVASWHFAGAPVTTAFTPGEAACWERRVETLGPAGLGYRGQPLPSTVCVTSGNLPDGFEPFLPSGAVNSTISWD